MLLDLAAVDGLSQPVRCPHHKLFCTRGLGLGRFGSLQCHHRLGNKCWAERCLYWFVHLRFCQAQPRPMQGLLIHVYQESKSSHIYKHSLCLCKGYGTELYLQIWPASRTAKNHSFPVRWHVRSPGCENSSWTRQVNLDAWKWKPADSGVLMNSGNNEMMKQGWLFGSHAHHCII